MVNLVQKRVCRTGTVDGFDEFCDFRLMDARCCGKTDLIPVGRDSFDYGDFILNSHCKSSFVAAASFRLRLLSTTVGLSEEVNISCSQALRLARFIGEPYRPMSLRRGLGNVAKSLSTWWASISVCSSCARCSIAEL